MYSRPHYQAYQRQHPQGLRYIGGLGGLLRAGSTVRYSANFRAGRDNDMWGSTQNAIESAVRGAVAQKAFMLSGISITWSSPSDGNIVVLGTTNIDRGSEQDLKSDIDNAIQSTGSSVLASAVQVVNASLPPGVTPPPGQVGTGTDKGDTYHNDDTTIGVAGQFWLDQIGQQITGAVKALGEGSPMMWLGVAAVAYLVFLRK